MVIDGTVTVIGAGKDRRILQFMKNHTHGEIC